MITMLHGIAVPLWSLCNQLLVIGESSMHLQEILHPRRCRVIDEALTTVPSPRGWCGYLSRTQNDLLLFDSWRIPSRGLAGSFLRKRAGQPIKSGLVQDIQSHHLWPSMALCRRKAARWCAWAENVILQCRSCITVSRWLWMTVDGAAAAAARRKPANPTCARKPQPLQPPAFMPGPR